MAPAATPAPALVAASIRSLRLCSTSSGVDKERGSMDSRKAPRYLTARRCAGPRTPSMPQLWRWVREVHERNPTQSNRE